LSYFPNSNNGGSNASDDLEQPVCRMLRNTLNTFGLQTVRREEALFRKLESMQDKATGILVGKMATVVDLDLVIRLSVHICVVHLFLGFRWLKQPLPDPF
jgi:hypothetical protein